jgi:hypothetical protein
VDTERIGFSRIEAGHYPEAVTYDPDRAAQDLPPWANDDRGRFYLDSEVKEVQPGEYDDNGFPTDWNEST